MKQLSGGDPVKITWSAGQNWQPNWSPDGKLIAYRSENADGGLFVIPTSGGSGMERKVSSFGYYPRWAPDGSKLLFQTRYGVASKIFVVDLGESDPPREVLTDVTSREFVISAAWHPDSKRISVWNLTVFPSPIPSFWTASVDSSKSLALAIKTEISPEVLSIAKGMAGGGIGEFADAYSDFKLCWAPSGKHIYFDARFAEHEISGACPWILSRCEPPPSSGSPLAQNWKLSPHFPPTEANWPLLLNQNKSAPGSFPSTLISAG